LNCSFNFAAASAGECASSANCATVFSMDWPVALLHEDRGFADQLDVRARDRTARGDGRERLRRLALRRDRAELAAQLRELAGRERDRVAR
jgi:hypothetical protein